MHLNNPRFESTVPTANADERRCYSRRLRIESSPGVGLICLNYRVALFAVLVFSFVLCPQGVRASDECSRIAQMQVYSNAFIQKETADVLGYELAINRHRDSTVDAFFYVYEGAPNNEGIPLSGRISGNDLSVQGNWVEHLIEYPSKKQIVQTHFVELDGALDSHSFRGKVTIEGMEKRDSVSLKRVKSIWLCGK
ncbi:MAG TPA: hypothetical protein VF753_13590 [Terriglobales bacterium]